MSLREDIPTELTLVVHRKKTQRKAELRASALNQLCKQGSIHNISTAEDRITNVISAPMPATLLANRVTEYTNKHPAKIKNPAGRFDRVSRGINSAF